MIDTSGFAITKASRDAILAWQALPDARGDAAAAAKSLGWTYSRFEKTRFRLKSQGRTNLLLAAVREMIDVGVLLEDRFVFQCYAHDPDGGPLSADEILRVNITKLRKLLKPGWQIVNESGGRYRLVYEEPDDAV